MVIWCIKAVHPTPNASKHASSNNAVVLKSQVERKCRTCLVPA